MGFRYIGSKDKLSDTIISEIRKINKSTKRVIDLMAGTGLFSLALREEGFLVTGVDVMTYSFHHLSVHLSVREAPKFKGLNRIWETHDHRINTLFKPTNYEIILDYLNNLKPIRGYFFNEFGPSGTPANAKQPRKYFTAANAAKIDAIRKQIKLWNDKRLIDKIEHSLLLHDLIMATNDIANIAGTYGHYLSKFVSRAEQSIQLKATAFSGLGIFKGHQIYRGYAEELSTKLRGDICYIDPPYIKRQYAANYHILETLAREDDPEATGESGLRPWRDQYSNFCTKTKIRSSFDQIISNIKCKDFLISYSEDGLLKLEELTHLLRKYGTVIKKEIKHRRFKSNDSKKHPVITEYLIHLRKN
jgi:adenine-specific DNA-methyltransferase